MRSVISDAHVAGNDCSSVDSGAYARRNALQEGFFDKLTQPRFPVWEARPSPIFHCWNFFVSSRAMAFRNWNVNRITVKVMEMMSATGSARYTPMVWFSTRWGIR